MPACWSRRRARSPTTGSRGRRPCSARPPSATTSTGWSSSPTARWTYFAGDIAYHRDKFRRGFRSLIDVWGADHGGYVKRMQAAVKAITEGQAALDVKICQLVRIMDNGEPVKMSKRAGTFVTLREVVDEVGKDVVRFIMLTRKNDAGAGFRPRQGDRAVARQSGVLRAVRPCPQPFGAAHGGRRPCRRSTCRRKGCARRILPALTDESASLL